MSNSESVESLDGHVTVTFSNDGQIADVLIDRERKLNALTLAMLDELEAVCRVVDDSQARVVVIRSAGTRVFCVGADITHFSGLDAAKMWRVWVATGHRAFSSLASMRQPTIAAVDGIAFGGGLELALACDFRVMTDEAKIGLPEGGLGTVPGWGGTERLTELVGRGRAKELVLTRRQLSGTEALEWGIATRTVPAQELDAAVDKIVSEILGSAPIATQIAKQLINAAADGAPSSVLEALAGGLTAATSDLAEGISAFHEKRAPNFSDR
jgi:enoyl-CoA hydratase